MTVAHFSPTRRKLDQSEIPLMTHSEPNADSDVPENYVSQTLRNTVPRPALTWRNFWTELHWVNITVLTITPLLGLYGLFSTKFTLKTFLFALCYGYFTALGMYPTSS